MSDNNAAHEMLNMTLKSGWFVKEKPDRDPNQSGSNFSVGYIVEKDGSTSFMKAFDFTGFLSTAIPKEEDGDIDVIEVMNDMTNAFIYERELSNLCKSKNVTKVSFVKESGQESVSGYLVPYLIFDLAEGDIRKTLKFSSHLDHAWKFKSLRDIATGLKQLHLIDVSHQDLKPSNILVFNSESKLGDLGRSICKSMEGPYNKRPFTGDFTYAPPEIWYRYYEKDWNKRVFATDCYMLGGLIVFYFTGISMSALLNKYIPSEFSWRTWRGTLDEIMPYLENAFNLALEELEKNVASEDFKEELKQLVEYLCNPFPERRGHPKNIKQMGSNYEMERFIARLDVLRQKAELKIKSI